MREEVCTLGHTTGSRDRVNAFLIFGHASETCRDDQCFNLLLWCASFQLHGGRDVRNYSSVRRYVDDPLHVPPNGYSPRLMEKSKDAVVFRVAHAYYNVSPISYYKDDSRWSADLKSKVAEDILSNGSIMEVFVLNHIFTCWENIRKILIIGTQRSDNLQADDEMDSTNDENYDAKPYLIEGDDDKLIAIFGRDKLSEDEMQGYKLTQEGFSNVILSLELKESI
ncbi:hypothetical protein Tco_1328985 [Tanacetum coccineum]